MSAPLPEAVRARFQTLIEEGLSGRAAALRLKLSPVTGARWGLSIRRTGRARAARQGRPRGKGKLDTHRSFLVKLVEQNGDMNRASFDVYVEKELAPTLKQGDIVILDNLPAHKSEHAKKALRERGA